MSLPASRSSNGAAAAYWASLGLSPETAEKNLQKCRVRIQSIDVQGATELGAALSELGVRVVKRSPDLTVTLVNDYLEGRLAELNRQHLSDDALAARPTLRHFSPGGAGVQPGQERLLDVSCRSDETEPGGQGAPRPQTGPLRRRFASGPADAFGQSAIQLAAVEIAKAIATDFRTELRDHIISLDLLGSTIVKHYVAARPQCPSCGRKKLRDPAPCASAGRAWRRRQAGHDERRVPDRFAAGHGCAFPQAREPAHRRGLASRADRSRLALEHQLLCHAQFFGARQRRSMSSGRD